MMPWMSSEQYEVMYTMRTEFAKKYGHGPGCQGSPRGFGPGGFGPRYGPAPWFMDVSPAERDVFMKYRAKGASRTAFGGLLGATTMAGVWNAAALGTGMGVLGVLVGGAIGVGASIRTSDTRRKLFTELLRLPSEKAPHAAQAREILQTKLPHNSYAQELLRGAGLPSSSSK